MDVCSETYKGLPGGCVLEEGHAGSHRSETVVKSSGSRKWHQWNNTPQSELDQVVAYLHKLAGKEKGSWAKKLSDLADGLEQGKHRTAL